MKVKSSLSWRKQLCILSCKWQYTWSCPTSPRLFVMLVFVWLVSGKTQDIHICCMSRRAWCVCDYSMQLGWINITACNSLPIWWVSPANLMGEPCQSDGWTLPIWWVSPTNLMGEPCQSEGWTLPIWWVNPTNLMGEPYQALATESQFQTVVWSAGC